MAAQLEIASADLSAVEKVRLFIHITKALRKKEYIYVNIYLKFRTSWGNTGKPGGGTQRRSHCGSKHGLARRN